MEQLDPSAAMNSQALASRLTTNAYTALILKNT